MASKAAERSLRHISRRPRQTCECASSNYARSGTIRQFSTSIPSKDIKHSEPPTRPRWSYTPEAMKAPVAWRINDPDKAWISNNDPGRLDGFYSRFLGRGGESLLTDEVKWLAVTHKSFDQGRRGFNDRLSFLGRRIVNLQANLALLHSSSKPQMEIITSNSDNRQPFKHHALDGLANITETPMSEVLSKEKFASLARQNGLLSVLRWKPKNPANLEGSGVDVVLTTTLYAIVGAIALQKGGDVAAEVAKRKILKPMGIV